MKYGKTIVMISPYRQLSEFAGQVSSEMEFNVEIAEEVLEEGVQLAKKYERKGVECIISRGATGILIKNNVSVPVVLVQITAFDILNALFKAKEMGQKIAFFEHYKRKNHYDFQQILDMLNSSSHQVEIFYYRDLESLKEQITRAAEWKAEVAVGTGQCTLKIAGEKGIRGGVMVCSTREAIVDAFQRAIDIVSVQQKERKAAEFMNTVINNVDTGIIVLNENRRITHFNPVAEKLLGRKRENIIGQSVPHLSGMQPQVVEFLKSERETTSRMLDIGEKKIYAYRLPLLMDDEHRPKIFGAIITLQEVGKIQKMEAKIRKELYAKGLVPQYNFGDIVGESTAMKRAVTRARRYANTDTTVLLIGESGTGKELIAHSIHNESKRKKGPFVAFNCSTIPEQLLESELFGYSEGAFTGAKKGGKPGLFEVAHGGTIFLDEIMEMPLNLQARLLRVLEEKAVRRVGDDKMIPVDVRILAATNRNPGELVKENLFREDLYFRLNVLSLKLPPLRERKEDILQLIKHYLEKTGADSRYMKAIEAHRKWVEQYLWPGNARELASFVEKFITLGAGGGNPDTILRELIEELYSFGNEYLSDDRLTLGNNRLVISIGTLDEMETEIIEKLQRLYPSKNKSVIAERLNISRTTLWKKLKSAENKDPSSHVHLDHDQFSQ